MIKVGIVGDTGYTRIELLHLLINHPAIQIEVVTSRTQAGIAITNLFSNLGGHIDLLLTELTVENVANCKIIDLSAFFLIKDVTICKQWYGMEHACPHLLINLVVYGLAILSLIDNLVKAIQNMNIICDLPETIGLMNVALSP